MLILCKKSSILSKSKNLAFKPNLFIIRSNSLTAFESPIKFFCVNLIAPIFTFGIPN